MAAPLPRRAGDASLDRRVDWASGRSATPRRVGAAAIGERRAEGAAGVPWRRVGLAGRGVVTGRPVRAGRGSS
ncbi:MAG: hypothetical protein QM733_19300 [Ilumatobacteraceae bacterium]